MAGVICPACQEANTDGEALCRNCGFLLEEAGPAPDPPRSAAPAAAPDTCPACGAEVPDAANLVCVECLEPLTPPAPPWQAPPLPTFREDGPVSLRLLFGGPPVEVPRAGSLMLGRDPDQSPVADRFADCDNVSRRHASVGVEPDGSVWVRDEDSANGTFVNDTRIPSGGRRPLAHGDRLRLASDVIAQVEVR